MIFVRDRDIDAIKLAEWMIEEGQWYSLGKGYRVRSDKPHTTGMQDHNHLYFKKNQIATINRDGTASHGDHRDSIPNWVYPKLRAKGLLEESFLIETGSAHSILVPAELIQEAEAWHSRMARLARLFSVFTR